MTTRLELQRPPSKYHRNKSRPMQRGFSTLPHPQWGDPWPVVPDPLDVSATIFDTATGGHAFANVTALAADAVYGNTGTGKPANGAAADDPPFAAGQYVTINGGASRAHWTTVWATGAAPAVLAAPTSSNTKAQILEWLGANGVDITEPAVTNLTKAELLALVQDVLDGE